MNTKRFCILLLLPLITWVLVSELPAQATHPPAPSGADLGGLDRTTPGPSGSDLDVLDPSIEGEAYMSGSTTDSATVRQTASQVSGSTPGQASQVTRVDFGLEEIIVSLEKALPPTWHIADLKRRQVPRKWLGPADAVLVRLEDASMVVHHTNGFDYHPFYKIWLCPLAWQGSMENVVIQGDEGPSVLLGINHTMKVFYLTLGANTWPGGPQVLRKTLDLTALPITASLKQTVDPSMKTRLFKQLEATANGSSTLLLRVVGMENNGPLAYIEYATNARNGNSEFAKATNGELAKMGTARIATASMGESATTDSAESAKTGVGGYTKPVNGDSATTGNGEFAKAGIAEPPKAAIGKYAKAGDSEFAASSRCGEPSVVSLTEKESQFLADQIFASYPEVRTVYLRRICDMFLSDKIIDRPGATSSSRAAVSNSNP